MAEQESVTLSWTRTTVEKFSVDIDADALRSIIAEHSPRQSVHDMLADRIDWLNTKETEAVLQAVIAHMTGMGQAPEGELQSEDFDDIEHDATDLSEQNTCDECGEYTADCTCCDDCGEADCVCGEDEDEDNEND